ncbi:GFA family protein [Tabrizicola sp.]|uniref:GFA family protein n=1 Tax=Tabrizicola sp. TaxID=2005166 RepID=UPI001A52B594|nr:GFA family protein [Tabrizicola sp.]MBL9063008.1 GFA family protein [Tabrizicola sp.]
MSPERPEIERAGGCLCGAVRFRARLTGTNFGACHCPMCRKWTGSALLGMTVPEGNVEWTGLDHVARRQSSAWGERAWCRECGSPVWFRVTVDSPYAGTIELLVGTFDNANGLTMTNEIYIDFKPDSYAFAGEGRKVLTRADCVARFPLLASG